MKPSLFIIINQIGQIPLPLLVQKPGKACKGIQGNKEHFFLFCQYLSDLIYYYKQGRFHALRLNSIIYYLGDMAWLPPIRFPDDYNQITAEEMADFLQQILNGSDYGTIILDIGDYGKQILPLLEICQVVYMPVKEDVISQAKLQEFEAYISDCGKKSLKDKFHRLHVPLVTGARRMEHFPQELLWGDMGDFVRGMLKGQRGLWEN